MLLSRARAYDRIYKINMSSPTDQQLVQFIGQGRRDALAQLFDRYSADLYDYLTHLVGDRDQAARLLETVFLRVPGAAPGFQPRDSVRGWLYSIAREAGLDWLRQRGWLDGLPPGDEAIAPGLQGDVWKAARAMPAFFRAVLITEELHPLSPSEKARALGVSRTDLPRLIEEARRSFNRIYDAQARGEGRPTSEQINPDTVWNARRRLPVEGGSLFGFLPLIALPDSLRDQIRRHVVEALAPVAARPPQTEPRDDSAAALGAAAVGATVAAGLANTPPTAPPQAPLPTPPTQTPPPQATTVSTAPTEPAPGSKSWFGGAGGLPINAIGALIGIALALLLCAGVYLLIQPRSQPSITAVNPANGATVQQQPQMTVFAVFQSEREIDRSKSVMQIDGQNRTPAFVENTIAWSGPLELGSHTAFVSISDTSGKSAEQTWTFFVVAGGATTPGANGSVTPLATVTPIFPLTPGVVTVTPIFPLSPTPNFFPTATLPVPPPTLPLGFTATPCTAGVAGVVFNDLNQNSIRDPNEPGLANINLTLLTQSNSFVSSTQSDTLGNYLFGNVQLGFYRVQAQTPPNWSPTSSTTLSVNLLGCGVVNNFNFGFTQAPTVTPSFTPSLPAPFIVTAVNAFVNPTNSTACPTEFFFTGRISASGSGTVQYRWIRSDGAVRPIQTLFFPFAGQQSVAPDTWVLNSTQVGWARLEILAPNPLVSPQAQFSLNCAVPTTPTFTPTHTPTYTPTVPPVQVMNATASVSPNSSTTCPQTFNFTAAITTNGAANVKYQWIRSDGATEPPQIETFLTAGTQNVGPYPWTLGAPGFVTTGGARIKILEPNVLDSNQATFSLNCGVPTLSPTPTVSPTPVVQVTNVVASVSPVSTNACPQIFAFSGDITTNGAANVTYQWERSDGGPTVPNNIVFGAAGTQSVPFAWTINGPLVQNGLWARLKILTPNVVNSNQATFDVTCP